MQRRPALPAAYPHHMLRKCAVAVPLLLRPMHASSYALQKHGVRQGPQRGWAALSLSTVCGASGERTVVVVESPAKAKTIENYLGEGYTVLASFGHVRDLVAKNGSVRPEEDFAMRWEVNSRGETQLNAITAALASAQSLVLATDPDREGEAISWHVQQVLGERGSLQHKHVTRVTFNEITQSAVLQAMAAPREVSEPLVQAYLARRALDYLVGFTLSPLLWRKVPGCRSAGRVQSVALRLVCEREKEYERFVPQEFWTVHATLQAPNGSRFSATLSHLNGEKLDKFGLPDAAAAARAQAAVLAAELAIDTIKLSQKERSPNPPFITSTLQQEASAKLGMSATTTMSIAQRLYEGVEGSDGGLITYMRTDGVSLSEGAVQQLRSVAEAMFGTSHVPQSPRVFKSKSKNAQEAHEAIRPTDPKRTPEDVAHLLDGGQLRLYTLIWQRALACQMSAAVMDQVKVVVAGDEGSTKLSATASAVKFKGWLAVYDLYTALRDDDEQLEAAEAGDGEGTDREVAEAEGATIGEDAGAADPTLSREERAELLRAMAEGDALSTSPEQVEGTQHWTSPPPRYTEASLVKRLEEEGIGRPSTYAPIMRVLLERAYVRKEGKKLVPESRGRILTSFLGHYFPRYVDYQFSADMEGQLDTISAGDTDYKRVLNDFWEPFQGLTNSLTEVRITEVIDMLDAELGPHFFSGPLAGTEAAAASAAVGPLSEEEEAQRRRCPMCTSGRLGLKLSRNGGFIGCSAYPECRFVRPLQVYSGDDEAETGGLAFPHVLGTDPETGLEVALKLGPYGPYVQRGDKEKGEKVTRASVAKGTAIAGITLEQGPRVVGVHPESQLEIELCNGVFGWYVRCDGVNASIPRRVDVDALDLATAAQLIDAKVEKLAKKAAKLAAEGRSPASKGKGKGKGKGKDTKRKKQKAAPGPRRPASAYLLYCKEHREAVKAAAAPELRSMVEVTKALAAQWKALPAAQRAPYEALAGAEKARYQELLVKEPTTTTTTSEAGGVVQKAGKATGTAKDHKAADAEGGVALPAKPAGAFFLFSREHREAVKTEHPEVKGAGPIAKILGQRWAELDPSVKADYQARAAADRARYDEQVQRLTQPV